MKLMKFTSILIILTILTACGSPPSAPTPDPTQVILSLAGTYTVHLTSDDLQKSDLNESGLESNLGTWLIQIKPDGNFETNRNGQFIASGNLGANGAELNIQVLNVCESCSCAGNIGRYTWSVDPSELVFNKIYDLCDAMAFLLTSKPLQRVR